MRSYNLILRDFHCEACNLRFEDLIRSGTKTAPCPNCKAKVRYHISPVRIDRTSMALGAGATPTSIDHFERLHKERKAIEERRFAEHGDYGSQPGSDGGVVTQDKASDM